MDALETLLFRYPVLAPCRDSLAAAIAALIACYEADGTVFTCGNGGSAADADHIVGELLKGFTHPRPLPPADKQRLRELDPEDGSLLADRLQCGLRAFSLMSQIGITTAVGNDLGDALAPAQQLYGLGRPGDVLIALSTSGNARNVALAVQIAHLRKMTVIGLTGAGGGRLARLADIAIRAPAQQTYQIQELHLPIYHALCIAVENHFFPPAP
ncbi:MAG TPA: SIS domain-containing protein [Lentisphaeria bacterium]|nr:SIS domain-containing protein [Lentisphaerota bacterium]OQC17454.1 MAG: Phosphoheptose isomerase [Lentisphaerae bacterium ADurb.Bin082]HQC51828.1 SIS domain-containing protein [Lentisphaeria bacterium]HQL86257.1 SIS domain-containing protein [Lentisphaeria bacterium]